jgi:Protein of unknown function (DUF742)
VTEWGPRLPDPRMIAGQAPQIRRTVAAPPTPTTVPIPRDTGDEPEQDSIVRPFIVTGGRTRPIDDRLRVETLVAAEPAALSAPLNFERSRIVRICQRPASVAEVAAYLGVPIGVAKVLIADLEIEQLVTIHDHVEPHSFLTRSVLERIRDGVRAL